MAMSDCKGKPHDQCDPDKCFGAKMRYIRENGGLSVQYPYGGRQTFKGPTIKERADREIALAAANGTSLRPINPLYDRPNAYSGGSK